MIGLLTFLTVMIIATGSETSRNVRQAQVIFETYDPLVNIRLPTISLSATTKEQPQLPTIVTTAGTPSIQFVFEQVDYTFAPFTNLLRTTTTRPLPTPSTTKIPTTTRTTATTTATRRRTTPSTTTASTTTTPLEETNFFEETTETTTLPPTTTTSTSTTTRSTVKSTLLSTTRISSTTKLPPTTTPVDILIATDSSLIYSERKPQMQYNTENFCDSRVFSDSRLKELQLVRLDYFVANTSCSSVFYKCGDGESFLLRCSGSQVFDPVAAYCNYKINIAACAEYDPVLHCRLGGSCKPDQFACCAAPQSCIDFIKRCDGVADCADGEDEVNCQSCPAGEFACHKAERCVPMALRCNGVNDCGDETALDERSCDVCPGNRMFCSRSVSNSRYSCLDPSTRCNSVRDCPNGEDELNCKARGAKVLLCENQKSSVPKEKWCDGFDDCSDGSDEKYCF